MQPKTYIINLDRSAERFARMAVQLDAIGLEYQRFSAIDGKKNWTKLSKNLDQMRFERNVGRRVLPGEIGCYMSHLELWSRIATGPDEIALILEDDVIFHEDFPAALQRAEQLADFWDVLKLNRIRAKAPKTIAKIDGYDLNIYRGAFTGMGAYLIKKDAAQRLLPGMLPIRRPIDHEIDRPFSHPFVHCGFEPFPSHVDDGGDSTITGLQFTGVDNFPKWQQLPKYWARITNRINKVIWAAGQKSI